MSDLANSCEYITYEKTCTAIIDSQKAKTNRELRCLNDEKQSCCYICDSRPQCPISCKYLGNTQNAPAQKTEGPKPQTPIITASNNKPAEANITRKVPVTYCSSCNVEMSPKRTKLRIDDWDNKQQQEYGDYVSKNQEFLPVIAYLCPCCGRIEFKADNHHNSS